LSLVLFLDDASRGQLNWDDWVTRLWVATVIALFAAILPYDYLRLDQELDYYVTPGKRAAVIWPSWLLTLAAPLYVLSMLLPPLEDFGWLSLLGALMAIVVGVVAVAARREGRCDIVWPTLAYAALGLLALGTLAAVFMSDSGLALFLSIAVVALLELPRFLVASRTLRKRIAYLRDEGTKVGGFATEVNEWRKKRRSNRQQGSIASVKDQP
jgi:hypothetical protein